MKIKLLLCIFMLAVSLSKGQDSTRYRSLTFGLIGGYHSAYSGYGLSVNYELKRRIELNAGITMHRFQGAGFSAGARLYFMKKSRIRPFMAVNYLNVPGKNVHEKRSNTPVHYLSYPHQYIVPSAGLRYDAQEISLLAAVDYQFPGRLRETVYLDGTEHPLIAHDINRANGGGWGATFSVIFHWW